MTELVVCACCRRVVDAGWFDGDSEVCLRCEKLLADVRDVRGHLEQDDEDDCA